jgi:hypothetical protein
VSARASWPPAERRPKVVSLEPSAVKRSIAHTHSLLAPTSTRCPSMPALRDCSVESPAARMPNPSSSCCHDKPRAKVRHAPRRWFTQAVNHRKSSIFTPRMMGEDVVAVGSSRVASVDQPTVRRCPLRRRVSASRRPPWYDVAGTRVRNPSAPQGTAVSGLCRRRHNTENAAAYGGVEADRLPCDQAMRSLQLLRRRGRNAGGVCIITFTVLLSRRRIPSG